jgi:broad specificity phosphatase PhoE
LHLVRHGRTTLNAEGRLLGRLDPELDAIGVAQAKAAAEWLAGSLRPTGKVRVVSSPLLRARATAEVVASALGVDEVEIDDRWLELDYGALDGVPLVEVPDETWAQWRRDADFCPPGGECLSALGARVRPACADLRPWASGGDEVVVVSHVSPIKAAVAWTLDVGDLVAWRLYLAPGSITRIGMSDRGASLQEFNRVP